MILRARHAYFVKPEIRCQNVLHSQKLCQSRKAEQQHLTHLKNVSRQNIRSLRILSHTASKQGFYRDCSPGPTDLNPSQVAILAHKHWVGVAFFLFWLYVSFSLVTILTNNLFVCDLHPGLL